MNYYNEHDPKAAAWLRELIKAGEIPDGVVDERDIQTINPNELTTYIQCHFFAGIGGWSYALKLAGWPEDEPVWTGSCPCQPFSLAGKQAGKTDARHLWPAFSKLIGSQKPSVVFGEQVASAIKFGWLDEVQDDFKKNDYEFGASILSSDLVGSPQKRKRIYWVASNRFGKRGQRLVKGQDSFLAGQWNWNGEADMQQIFDHPFERLGDNLWPEALVRRVDDGIPARVDALHGYGNAIVPQVAAAFIQASVEAINDIRNQQP